MSLRFTDQRCIAEPLTESTSGMLAFPWIAHDQDTGLLIMSYHDGVDGPGGVTRLRTSDDLGLTWSTGLVVWDEGLGTGAQVAVLSSGHWLLTSQGYTGGAPSGVYSRRSVDQGATWGSTQHVLAGVWTSTAVFETASGTLLWPVYQPQGGRDVALVLASTDHGYTWSDPTPMMALTGGVDASEATLQQFPDGTLVALVRCGDFTLRRTVSTDDGATWSTPQTAIPDVESRVDWVRLASGRCVAAWRDHPTGCAMAAYSDDAMVNVSTALQIHGPDKRTSYSALAEVADGQVLAAIGEIDDTEANGRIMARYLLDGDGVAPTGQATYLDSQRRAGGNVLAWDTFQRPDNAQGLGSADSGHQWFEYGGGSNSDWELSGGQAANAAPRIHSVTLDTGNAWGFIEADLMWTGSTSSPIGLCAKRSTATGHALVAKLDSGGQTARICYFDGTAITDLATPATGLHYPAGTWCRWRFTVRPGYARLFIDGHEVLSYALTTADHTNLDPGTRWGLWGGGSSGTTYRARNVLVSGS